METNIPIETSVFSEEFENVNYLNILLLTKNNSETIWKKYIDKNSTSYFNLNNENWIIKSNSSVIGEWLTSFNKNDNKYIENIMNKFIDWHDNSIIYFCISSVTIIETTWGIFKKTWINFLACDDDCPIIINVKNKEHVIVFTPLGDIIKTG